MEARFMTTAKIVEIGDVAGILLPPDVLAKLRVETGDTLCITETPRGIELTRNLSTLADQLKTVEAIMSEHREVLKKLSE